MSANDIQSETIVSAEIVSDPAGLCVPGDPTQDCVDVTNPDARVPGAKGHGKTSPSNSGNTGSQGA
jgi:hypothetical protein